MATLVATDIRMVMEVAMEDIPAEVMVEEVLVVTECLTSALTCIRKTGV
jgi:hypothetical protein